MASLTERLVAVGSGVLRLCALPSGVRGKGLAPTHTPARHRSLDRAAAMGGEAAHENRLPGERSWTCRC